MWTALLCDHNDSANSEITLHMGSSQMKQIACTSDMIHQIEFGNSLTILRIRHFRHVTDIIEWIIRKRLAMGLLRIEDYFWLKYIDILTTSFGCYGLKRRNEKNLVFFSWNAIKSAGLFAFHICKSWKSANLQMLTSKSMRSDGNLRLSLTHVSFKLERFSRN